MTTSVNTLMVEPHQWFELSLRLGMAVFFGGAIGWNREAAGKAAGLRTHMLVGLGAALFVMVPIQAGSSEESLSRTIQGIATGIGFLGAGEIVHYSISSGKLKVKGLTSAASIWVTAAMGVLAGCGLWQSSLIATVLTLLILGVGKYLERFVPKEKDTP